MLRPHHKSYYRYFEDKRQNSSLKYFDKRLKVYIIIRQLLGKERSVREYNFLFNKIKSFLGGGLNTPYEDKYESYLRFLDHSRPKLFDDFHVDLTHFMPIEEELHPWKLRYSRTNIQKEKRSLDRIRRAYSRIPNILIGLKNNN